METFFLAARGFLDSGTEVEKSAYGGDDLVVPTYSAAERLEARKLPLAHVGTERRYNRGGIETDGLSSVVKYN